jgi:hypothetical protein
MSAQSRIAACVLSLAFGPAALAQATGSTTSESIAQKSRAISGVVETVAGNKVVLREADGLHEYNPPAGFKFQLDGRDVGVDEIKPGMSINAVVTDKVITRQVTVTRIESGTVAQVAPGGIVLKDQSGDLKSYNFKDPAGNEIYFVRDGKEVPLRSVKVGDRLSGTFVTTLPAQRISQRSAVAKAAEPSTTPEPAVVAAATRGKLPKTASPLPLVGLLAALSAGIALTLRAARH